MAGRDINIPFGPDRTGGFYLSELIPEVEPGAEKTDAPDEASADLPDSAFEAAPARSYANDGADASSDLGATDSFPSVAGDEEVPADAEPLDEKEGQPGALVDVQASLVALKDSIDQSRELKARQKERDEFGQKLDADLEELADREDILANYQMLVAEQDGIIDDATRQREAFKAELSQLTAQHEETSDALQRMRDYHDSQLEPLEATLGRAKAAAEQAKNDERSRKSELSAAESERRRSEGGEDAAMAAAKYEVVQQAHEEAVARSEAAKEALDQIQKQYDELKERVEQAEAPLERSIEDLTAQSEELKEKIASLAETISVARKRRQYCDTVYQYPDETAKLRASVEADEETARRMDQENDELRDRLEQSKQRSKKAKLAIGAVVVIIIVIIVLFFVLSGR